MLPWDDFNRYSTDLCDNLRYPFKIQQARMFVRQVKRSLIFVAVSLVILISTSAVSAVPTGLTYLDSTWANSESTDGDLVTLNSENGLLASIHNDHLYFYNSTTLEKVFDIQMDRISGIQFSPSGDYLAINKLSTLQTQESLKILNLSNFELMDKSALVNDRSSEIAWSPDGQIIAAPGAQGDVDLLRFEDLSVKNSLNDVHNVEVSCIAYRPDGNYIMTGDISGRIAFWNSDGMKVGDYTDYGDEILDCVFSKDGMDVIILDSDGKLVSETFDGVRNFETIAKGAKKIIVPNYGNKLHILFDDTNFKGLKTIDSNTGSILKSTHFYHRASDIAMIEDEYGRLQKLFVTADTGQIAVYQKNIIPEGINEAGADLDGDSIPDNIDTDDDGDGIPDNYDDVIGCDSPPNIPCSRYPDLTKIRTLNIRFLDGEIIIEDTITLPTEASSNIRNLSRPSISKDQVLSIGEAELFSEAMCANMDHRDIIEQWKYTLSAASFELGSGNVSCKVNSGMVLVKQGDFTTQISISIISKIKLENKITLPTSISILEQPPPTDGSIAWLAPAHPVSVVITGEDIQSVEIPLWWNADNSELNFTLEKKLEDDPSVISKLISYATNPVVIIISAGIFIGLLTILIRKKNEIDIDMELDTPDLNQTQEDTMVEDFSESKYDEDNQDHQEDEDVVVEEPIMESKTSRKMYTTNLNLQELIVADEEAKVTNVDGPIMKTKRRRLVSDETTIDRLPRKKTVKKTALKTKKIKLVDNSVNQLDEESVNEPTIKVRRVKNQIDDKDADKKAEIKKNKRKPVRRKKKKGTKALNEDEIQENLVKEFLSDD